MYLNGYFLNQNSVKLYFYCTFHTGESSSLQMTFKLITTESNLEIKMKQNKKDKKKKKNIFV